MQVGERIQQLRKERGISQEQLAEMLQVSKQMISDWEQEKAVPTSQQQQRLSDIFDVRIEEDSPVDGGEKEHEATEVGKEKRPNYKTMAILNFTCALLWGICAGVRLISGDKLLGCMYIGFFCLWMLIGFKYYKIYKRLDEE